MVILVDENDRQVGIMEKMEAHRKAYLHRAISVFIVNKKGEWILQRRASEKYHSGGLWTNTCCTHPQPGESDLEAANRRLMQEMGIETELKEIYHFIYKEELDNNLTEYELDHVFIGETNTFPVPDPVEVSEWKAVKFQDLKKDIITNPGNYTVWFKKIFSEVSELINKSFKN